MPVEVSENWLTAGTIIGFLAFGAVGTFVKLYTKSREDERTAVEATPVIARHGIGAAFVDRAFANDVAQIREDVGELRRIAEDRKEQEGMRDIVRDELRRAGHKRDDG